ncbi:UDP-N-acetylenolpyruvoylglucosamine reductase [Deltaproteobacteria bacterium]|nr:UDP-N-acetylenolpyruvoylglucosamine reductase [Deltaproteobacteria bacterium]
MTDFSSWRRLAEQMGERLVFEAPLKSFTTFGVGGPARILARPEKSGELRALAALARSEGWPALVLGGGSNILFADAGFDGLVVKLGGGFAALEDSGSGTILAGAAASSASLLARAEARELGGLECLAGLPGTVGGAVAGNAGSGGRAVGQAVARVFILGDDGEARALEAAELRFVPRRLEGLPRGAVILGVEFALTPRPAAEIRSRLRDLLERRRQSQPAGGRSAGCVFKNPPGFSAGRLIDECGFKGERVGGARISEIHANFIIAEDGASSADILALMDRVRRGVYGQRGLTLKPEIRIFGPGGEAAL